MSHAMAEVLGSPPWWAPPPARGPQGGGQHINVGDPGRWAGEAHSAESPAYDALDDSYKIILGKILSLPDEAEREAFMVSFKSHDNPEVGKAMLAAYTETMATRQAATRPVLRHPAADAAGDLASLRKERNKAANQAQQTGALVQRKKLQVLELQERLAQAQKEEAEAIDLCEQHDKYFALKDQQLSAAMADRERLLLQEAGTPVPTASQQQPWHGLCQNEGQAMQLQQGMANAVTKLLEARGGNTPQVLDALLALGTPAPAPIPPGAQAAQAEPAGAAAPPTPTLPVGPLPKPAPELNEVSMAEGKRKGVQQEGEDDNEDIDDGEELAVTDLLGGEVTIIKKGKKTKTEKSFCPTLAQTIRDTELINRAISKNLRGPEAAASSSASQLPG